MKLALIPPISLLETADTDYHMVLPQLLKNKRYADFYKKKCQDPAQFVILDNGKAEQVNMNWKFLSELAVELGVNELVLPDIMRNEALTRIDALTYLDIHGDYLREHNIRTMFVIHGTSITEVRRSIEFAESNSAIDTIGLPRILLNQFLQVDFRFWLAENIRKPVHFLGMSGKFPDELKIWSKAASMRNIRGVDTSASYNFTYAQKDMNWVIKSLTNRPDNYFDIPSEFFSEYLLRSNIDYLKRCLDV